MNSLPETDKATIRLSYVTADILLSLPFGNRVSLFPGATIRGGIGHCMKQACCRFAQKECETCERKNECAYMILFNPVAGPDMPRPVILRTVQRGGCFAIRITLFGRAVRQFKHCMSAISLLGENGIGKDKRRFRIIGISTDENRVFRESAATDIINKNIKTVDIYAGVSRRGAVTIDLISPLAIKRNKKILDYFDPDQFIRALLRRVKNLSAWEETEQTTAFDEQEIPQSLPPVTVSSSLLNHSTEKRFSTRQNKTINCYGISGAVRLEGDTGRILPLLKAGEITGVGKNTLFGFGTYVVSHSV